MPSAEFLTAQTHLREFLTAAILTAGQEFASLLPPITHDGHEITRVELSPDGSQVLTLGAEQTARLWDTRTGHPLTTLRVAEEAVVDCGFSPDGRTAFTDDPTMTIRLWDAASGQYRCHTESPAKHALIPKAEAVTRKVTISDNRLLTHALYHEQNLAIPLDDRLGLTRVIKVKSAVELWDTATGRLVTNLNRLRFDPEFFQLLGRRWIAAREGTSTAIILSAEDGRELTRKRYQKDFWLSEMMCSRDEVWVTVKLFDDRYEVLCGADWTAQSVRVLDHQWEGREILDNGTLLTWDYRDGLTCGVERLGSAEPVGRFKGSWSRFPSQGDLALVEIYPDGRKVIDTQNGKPLHAPVGRRYHPDLARFAPDGRFVNGVDVVAEKRIPTREDWGPNRVISSKQFFQRQVAGYAPGFGQIAAFMDYTASLRVLPAAERVAIPADVLELWLQVCLRGEIGPDEDFVKWDEPTWEAKRRQLAAMPVPYADFPFPGYVVTDKLHWLRSEYPSVKTDADRIKIARELLRRCEEDGNKNEAVRWQAELAKLIPEIAPPPRAVK